MGEAEPCGGVAPSGEGPACIPGDMCPHSSLCNPSWCVEPRPSWQRPARGGRRRRKLPDHLCRSAALRLRARGLSWRREHRGSRGLCSSASGPSRAAPDGPGGRGAVRSTPTPARPQAWAHAGLPGGARGPGTQHHLQEAELGGRQPPTGSGAASWGAGAVLRARPPIRSPGRRGEAVGDLSAVPLTGATLLSAVAFAPAVPPTAHTFPCPRVSMSLSLLPFLPLSAPG